MHFFFSGSNMDTEVDVTIAHFLTDYVANYSDTLFFLLDGEGTVVRTNHSVEKTIGRDVAGEPFTGLLVDFTGSFVLNDVVGDGSQRYQLTLGTSRQSPYSFWFRFYRSEDIVVVLGESDQHVDTAMRENLVQMNREFSNLSRELQKKTIELEKLNALKNHFIGTAAHDLRNPVGAIHSLARALLEDISGTLQPDHAEILELIGSASGSVLMLLDDLLSIAQIEAGKLDLRLKEEDIVDFIKYTIRVNSILAVNRGITIRLECLEEIPPVAFDRARIEQVMNNLLSNAIKYSAAQSEIVVSVFQNGDDVTVTVRDTGPGIKEEERDRLFKPFSRLSTPVPEGQSSTGLGLSIAHSIVLSHRGKIGVDSTVGEGSSFYFSLPLVHDRDREDSSASS